MKDIWDKPITADTDWGGDASTGGLPVSGKIVQEYIKSRLKTDDQLKAFIKAYLDENGMSEDQGYVTLATEQTIKAIKDFEAGLKIGGSLITYDKDLNAFILRANLVTEGGITARALLDDVDVPTFMDGVVTDEVTISKADGVLRVLKAGLDKEELINILEEEKYVTQSWVKSYNAEELKKYVLKTDLPSDIVTLSIDQEITGIKNFANGFEIAGIKFSKSQDGTIFLDGNLVTSGGITARGTNTTTTPSLFDALPIDGCTIKRDANNMLYVDAEALNVSGGFDEEQLAEYLEGNGYATKQWVTEYISPGGTPSSSGLILEYLSNLDAGGVGRFFTGRPDATNSPRTGWTTGITLALDASTKYRRQLVFSSSDNIYVRREENGSWRAWLEVVTSNNIGSFALPLTGGTVDGKVHVEKRYAPDVVTLGNAEYSLAVGDPLYGTALWTEASGSGYIQQKRFDGNNTSYLLGLQPLGGNVAIGGTTATARLHVYNTSGWGESVESARSAVSMGHADGYGMSINSLATASEGKYLFKVWAGSLSGSAGTGETLFEVNANKQTTVGGNLLVTGGLTARYTSDRRLKKNIRNISASEMLMSLGGVRQFEYIPSEIEKNKIYEGTHIGLIYQNVVGSALDRMCHEREDGYGSLNYLEPSFISLIAGATMENTSEIEVLKKRVESLEKRM